MSDEKEVKKEEKEKVAPVIKDEDAPHGIDEEGNIVGANPPRKAW